MRPRSFGVGAIVTALMLLVAGHAPAQTPPRTGLDWDGTAPALRMLYWHNVPPVYPMTVFAKVYMRSNASISRQDGCKYGTIFFWGNDGDGAWDNGSNNSFWGIEPYPRPLPGGTFCPKGPWQFEIATWNRDYVTRMDGSSPDIVNNRWYSVALAASRPGGNGTQSSHVAWVDLPSTANAHKITSAPTYHQPTSWTKNPPVPAIFFGQSPQHPKYPAMSWGGYYRWDECNCIIRGIQMYTVALTQTQIVALQACETDQCVIDTAAAQGVSASLWYANMNPKPTDVTDKSGKGHHGSWNGTGARPLLWTDPSGSPPPSGNRPPVISGNPPTTAPPGQLYSFTPTSSDPDGNPLTFTIANRPSWATFNSGTGRLQGTPSTSNAGTYGNIVISASDGQATASLPAFTITVSTSNRAPLISGTPQTSVLVGQSYAFTPTASDPDGDALQFSVTNPPSWATFDTATGRLSGMPTSAHVGTYSNIVIRVTDGRATTSLPAFNIAVNSTANGSVTLTWQPPTHNTDGSQSQLAGFRVYWGNSQGNYPNSRYFNNPGLTSAVIDQLTPATYYFVITAVNTNTSESQFSNSAGTVIR